MRGLRLNLRTTYTLTTSETMRRVRDRSHSYLTYGLAIMPFCATLEVSQRTAFIAFESYLESPWLSSFYAFGNAMNNEKTSFVYKIPQYSRFPIVWS